MQKYTHIRADSRFAPSQWETSLQSNTISNWLGTNLESALTVLYAIYSSKLSVHTVEFQTWVTCYWWGSRISYASTREFRHDDVIKWKHFLHYWPFVWGIHRSLVNSPHKGQWCGALMFSFICIWINGWVNNHEAGDLRWRHCNVMAGVLKSCSWKCLPSSYTNKKITRSTN